MFFLHKKRGIALILVIMVLFIATGLIMMIFSTSDVDRKKTILKREKVRAEMLAKGAVQLAMLKIRYFPTEFYDAHKLFEGEGYIGDEEITGVDEEYLGEMKKNDDGSFNCTGVFVRDLGIVMGKDMEEGFIDSEGDKNKIKTEGPYDGICFVQKLELLSHDNANKFDTIKITVYAQEKSGRTTAVLSSSLRGTKGEKALNEGLTYSVIRELKWK